MLDHRKIQRRCRSPAVRGLVEVREPVAAIHSDSIPDRTAVHADFDAVYGNSFPYGKLAVDWCRGSVSTPNGSVRLLRVELRLLGALLERAGEPVHAHALIQSTWPDATLEFTTRSMLRIYMQSLRRRLNLLGMRGRLMVLHGAEYCLLP